VHRADLEDRVAVTALAAQAGRRQLRCGSGASSGCSPRCPASSPPTAHGPVAAARARWAQLSGRGVIVLISDLLDPAADKVIRELAATGSELIVLHVLSPDVLDPQMEGDVRLVTETGDGIDVTIDLTIDDYKVRLASWQEGLADPRRARGPPSRSPGSSARRARLRGAQAKARGRLMSFLSPLALLGLLFLPVVLAMYLLKLRRDERIVPSTLLWQRLLTDVEANAPWQRLRRSLLLLLHAPRPLLAILAARPFFERPAASPATWSSSSTRRRAWPRRTCRRAASPRRRARCSRPCGSCLRTAR
jgi:hypothetical protein